MDIVPDLTKYLVQAGIGCVLAAMMFFYYRSDTRKHDETVRAMNKDHREEVSRITAANTSALVGLLATAQSDRAKLIDVIVENTKSNQQLVTLLEAMHRRMDGGGGFGRG